MGGKSQHSIADQGEALTEHISAVPQMGHNKSLLMLPFQVAKVRELAERRVAQLNGRIQGLESRLHQLSEENRALASRAPSAQAGVNPQVNPQQNSTATVCSSHQTAMIVVPSCAWQCKRPSSVMIDDSLSWNVIAQV